MSDQLIRRYLSTRLLVSAAASTTTRRLRGDRGEGVISLAIAVLIIAFIGALMFVGLKNMWTETESKTTEQLELIQ